MTALLLLCALIAPPPPGLASQPSPPAIWIEWDERGKELSPSSETETLQEARFELSVENDPMGDWSLTGYQWSYRYPPLPGQSIPANALPVLAQGLNNRNAIGIAEGPGIFRAECTVKLLNPQGQPVNVIVSGTCAVVGGPIKIKIEPGDEPTWHHDGNKLDRAWFIEYFGYSHYAMPIPPTYLQRTQDCVVSVLPQPEGTVVIWFGPSEICSFILDLFPHAEAFDLAAEASFSDEPITAEFFLLFTPEDNGNPWPGPIEVTGEDDSAISKYKHPTEGLLPIVNRISAHFPQEMKYSRSSARYPAHPPGADYCGTDYWYKLQDQNGDPFPGVWIQERFPNPDQLPPNVETNPPDFIWLTTHPDGEMHLPDWLRYWWFYGDDSIYLIDHDYWAASKLTSGQSGLLVYEGIIFLYPGQPGIASQAP